MLPEWKSLKKRTRKMKIADEPYFALAEEYLSLRKLFTCEGMLDNLLLWFDMIIYPLYIVVQLCMLDFSPMYIFSIVSTYQKWISWFRLRELQASVDIWMETVKSVGGPWISSNDPDLHVFVYADGMERIKYSQAFRPSQKTVKTSPKVELPAQ